jgi:Fe-S oxidoreductase
MMTQPELKQNRLGWLKAGDRGQGTEVSKLTPDPRPLTTFNSSDTLYFTGCAPHYDALFAPLGVKGTSVAQASVRVLNALGIEPQVLADERCCGHDLLWEGDVDRFMQLARLNVEMIRASGAKRIVSSCPECVRALKIDYPAYGVRLGIEVLHLSELLADPNSKFKIPNSKSEIRNHKSKITFHDPCRLGRHLGVYDAPRKVLEQLGYQVVEMRHNRRNATCCGTNGWTHCGAANKAIQVQRLREAKATGAETMVTACLKCQIHFKCALMDKQIADQVGIEMVDLAELVAMQISQK